MNSEEIKQTNIYSYFSNNKKTSTNFRIFEDKYNNDLLKKQISKKEKNEWVISKTTNLKIKDFFCFKEHPEEINNIQKDLKNMHILSDLNSKKCGEVNISNFTSEVTEFSPIIQHEADSFNNDGVCLNNNSFNKIGNNFNNLTYFQSKEKRLTYSINKYFPILETHEEPHIRQNMKNIINVKSIKNSKIFSDFDLNNIKNGEIEHVFILDHFNNKNEELCNDSSNNKIKFNNSSERTNNNQIQSNDLISSDISKIQLNSLPKTKEINMNNLYNPDFSQNLLNKKNLTVTNNPFILNLNNNKYYDTKITKYIHIQDPPNMKLNRELLVNVLEYIDLRHLIRKIPIICRFWNDLYNKTISSANYNLKLDFTDIHKINEREIQILFKKGKNLKHIKLLKEIISEDFGGIYKGVENFFKKIALIMTLADPKDIHHKGVMLNSFKLRPRKANEMNNFISNKSINLICDASKYSLKTLILRNCSKLTNKIFDGISSCLFLNTLEISFNK